MFVSLSRTDPGGPARGHRPRRPRWLRRAGLALIVAAVLAGLSAQAAHAHVSVHPDSTESGSFSQLTFRVPNESDTAGTVKVEVTLPQDKPFLDVSTKPVPGWTATVTKAPLTAPVTIEGTTLTEVARTVTWQAQPATRIDPGQYQDFDISVGPLPAAGTILLPATQTYSDGTVVAWDQPTPAGGPEPEHPAPELVVTAAGTPTASATAAGGATAAAAPANTSQPADNDTDTPARILGGAALAVALVGAVLAVWGRRRRPSTTA